MNLNFILSPWTLFFVAMIIIVVMLIFLTLLERKLKKRISIRKEEQTIFQRKLNALKALLDNPNRFLVAIDELARDFLSQHYKVERNLKYSELVKIFNSQSNTAAAQFCERIQEALYAGESASRDRLEFLIKNLEFLIDELNKKSQREEKPVQIQKKSPKVELDKRIVSYLSEGTRRGFSLELLRQKLLGAKFSMAEIQMAEDYLNLNVKPENKSSPVQETPRPQSESKTEKPVMNTKDHKFINSLDDLERIKGKISDKSETTGAKKISDRTGLV